MLDASGQVLNRAHEGYKSKVAAQKNAVRHGYGLQMSVSAEPTSTGKGVFESFITDCDDCYNPPAWLGWLLALLFVLVFFKLQMPAPVSLQAVPSDVQTTHGFTDVPSGDPNTRCFSALAYHDVLPKFEKVYADGREVRTFEFKPNNTVPKNELLRATLKAAGVHLTNDTEEVGWERHLQYAQKHAFRAFENPVDTYDLATRGEVALTVMDAFNLEERQADAARIFAAFGNFAPNELVRRGEFGQVLCEVLERL